LRKPADEPSGPQKAFEEKIHSEDDGSEAFLALQHHYQDLCTLTDDQRKKRKTDDDGGVIGECDEPRETNVAAC
jgi:hypothetical protein